MGRYIHRQPEFEARQFRYGVTEPKLFKEVFGYDCELDTNNLTLHVAVNPVDKEKKIVPDGWWFVQEVWAKPKRNFVMSEADFERTYEGRGEF